MDYIDGLHRITSIDCNKLDTNENIFRAIEVGVESRSLSRNVFFVVDNIKVAHKVAKIYNIL